MYTDQNLFYSRKKKILPHVLVWALYGIWNYFVSISRPTPSFSSIEIVILMTQIGVFYLNYTTLIPKFYFKKKYKHYLTSALLLLTVALIINSLTFKLLTPYTDMASDFLPEKLSSNSMSPGVHPMRMKMIFVPRLLGHLIFLLLSTLLRVFEESQKTEKKITELNAEKYNAELKFLKSQINPHFLFNALNNIYSLVISKAEKAPELLLKLSDMLRYLIYECNEKEVPIKREVEYVSNFIELQKLKDDQIKNITFNYQESEYLISPMLLIPFVENAFKHSRIEDGDNSWIIINLKFENGDFYFEVLNTIPKSNFKKDDLGGLGIENVKRRLDLIYPEKYNLIIQKLPDSFNVYLKITLY